MLLNIKKLFLAILLFANILSAENIVLIITDDQRFDQFNENAMPFTYRQFEKHGTIYKAVATIPVCCPSRAGIMTGLKPESTGIYSVGQLGNFFSLDKINDVLGWQGYKSGSFGKVINGYRYQDIGFDRMFIHTDDTWHDNINGYYKLNNSKPFLVSGLKSKAFANEAIKYLEQRIGKNTYIQLAFKYPHFHINNLEDWTNNRRIDIPESVVDKKKYKLQVRALREVDREIKKLFSKLNLAEDLIFFISDNGYSHGEWGKRGKSHPYPEGNYIPVGMINKGEKYSNNCLATNIDIATTIYDIKNIDQVTDGESLRSCTRKSFIVQNPASKPYFRVEYTQDSFSLLSQ